jgi:hypothetical protein
MVGLAVGASIGAVLGCIDEATQAEEPSENLIVGVIFCAVVCTLSGAIGGAVSGAIAWASGRRLVGVAAGLALPLVAWVATALVDDSEKLQSFVGCSGLLAGGVAAGLLCARQRKASGCLTLPSVQPVPAGD